MKSVLAYVLTMVAGAANAGAWEEFERRCLVPMENVQEPVTSGLEFNDANGDYLWFNEPLGSYVFFKIRLPDGRNQCALELKDTRYASDFISKARHWEQVVFEQNRYEPALTRHASEFFYELLSTDWREPKIRITFSMDLKFPSIAVTETDLES